MSNIQLIHEDCLNILPELKEVDLIITDPPYLMNYKTGHRKDKTHKFTKPILNDDNEILIHQTIPYLHRLLKWDGAIYMFCNSNHVEIFKQELQKYFQIKNILIWVKNNWTAGDLKGAYAKQTEFIIYAVKGRHILNGRRDSDILKYDRVAGKKQVHQNQKPVDLLRYLIEKSSNPGDTVLDCFMGSGSTGVACKQLGRDFIGIELDEETYNLAKRRINNYESVYYRNNHRD